LKLTTDGFGIDVGEMDPLELRDITSLATGKHVDGKVSVKLREQARSTSLLLEYIVVLRFSIAIEDMLDCGVMEAKLLSDGCVGHASCFVSADTSFLGQAGIDCHSGKMAVRIENELQALEWGGVATSCQGGGLL